MSFEEMQQELEQMVKARAALAWLKNYSSNTQLQAESKVEFMKFTKTIKVFRGAMEDIRPCARCSTPGKVFYSLEESKHLCYRCVGLTNA
jgi:hypothetical protein